MGVVAPTEVDAALSFFSLKRAGFGSVSDRHAVYLDGPSFEILA